MKEVIEVQQLLRRQKAYMKNILIMTEKLFEIQSQIAELTIKELKRESQKENVSSDLISSKDVCSMFGMSASTLYRRRKEDSFPYVKVEGRKEVMFSKKAIEEYFEKYKK